MKLDDTAGVSTFSSVSQISVFPNPSEGILSFTIPTAIQNAEVNVYSIDGKLIFSKKGNLEKTSTYNLKHLNNGLYFVKVSDGKSTSTAKWMKK